MSLALCDLSMHVYSSIISPIDYIKALLQLDDTETQ